PGEVFIDERLYYLILEIPLEVDDVVRNPQDLRHGASIIDVVERAAATRGFITVDFGQPPLVPELHGQADNSFAAREQHARDDGAIDSARHRDCERPLRHSWLL